MTQDGPMHLRGSSWMSCNLSVSESLLLRRALAFSACTWFLDPLSLGRLREYRGSGTFAAGGAETGLGFFCGWLATCFSTEIHCCWSLKLSIWLLVTGWPCQSLVPASRLLKEHSISSNSGDVDRDVLAELACLWTWSIRRWLWAALRWCPRRWNYQCHWYWYSLHLSFQMGNWAKTQKTH